MFVVIQLIVLGGRLYWYSSS